MRLIDFGLLTKYKDNNGQHIQNGIEDKFRGSLLFASKYAFNYVRPSRRDDMISLVYLLVFFLDASRLTFVELVRQEDRDRKFELIKVAKMRLGPGELCGLSMDETSAYCIYEFCEIIFNLEFEEKPDY